MGDSTKYGRQKYLQRMSEAITQQSRQGVPQSLLNTRGNG